MFDLINRKYSKTVILLKIITILNNSFLFLSFWPQITEWYCKLFFFKSWWKIKKSMLFVNYANKELFAMKYEKRKAMEKKEESISVYQATKGYMTKAKTSRLHTTLMFISPLGSATQKYSSVMRYTTVAATVKSTSHWNSGK